MLLALSADRIELSQEVLGSSVRLQSWTLKADAAARLEWPVYPYNPHAHAPETTLEHAVRVISVPSILKEPHARDVRPHEQKISFVLNAER